MAQTLESLGTLSYNGYDINGPRVRTTLRVTPHYSSDGRTVIYNVIELMVRFVLTSDYDGLGGGDPTDDNMVDFIATMTQAGGVLIFEGLGYGPFEINTADNPADVIYGPKPRLVSIEPIGANLAMRVTWTCEVALVPCALNGIEGFVGPLIELTYTNDWTVDQAGLTVIVIRGHSQIGLNRAAPGSPNIAFTADMNRQAIAPVPPLGFRLKSQDWFLSEDKSREDFTFIFEEIAGDNALPTYCSDIQFDQRLTTTRAGGLHILPTIVISGFVEVVKPQLIALGLQKVFLILNERITNMRNQGRLALIISMNVTEPVFNSRRVAFDFAFQSQPGTLNNGKPQFGGDPGNWSDVFLKAGMFSPVGSTDWLSWQNSMLENAWYSRGFYGQGFNPSNDLIVNQCNAAIPQLTLASGYPTGNIAQFDPGAPTNDPTTQIYLYYDGSVRLVMYPNSSTHFPLPTSAPPNSGGGIGSGSSGQPPVTISSDRAPVAAQLDPTLPPASSQVSGQKPAKIIFEGSAVRTNAPPELPTPSITVGGNANIQVGHSDVKAQTWGEYFGATLHGLSWYIEYIVSGANPDTIMQNFPDNLSKTTTGVQSDGQ
jgi:hypothetical protein